MDRADLRNVRDKGVPARSGTEAHISGAVAAPVCGLFFRMGAYCSAAASRPQHSTGERSHMSKINRRDFLKASAIGAAASAVPAPFIWPKGAHGAEHGQGRDSALADRHHRHRREARWSTPRCWRSRRSTSSGGVMGMKIEPVVEDGASDWPTFAEKARKLLEKDKVAAVIGCYTSASRKAVLPVFEKLQGPALLPDLLRRPGAVAQHHVHRAGGARSR